MIRIPSTPKWKSSPRSLKTADFYPHESVAFSYLSHQKNNKKWKCSFFGSWENEAGCSLYVWEETLFSESIQTQTNTTAHFPWECLWCLNKYMTSKKTIFSRPPVVKFFFYIFLLTCFSLLLLLTFILMWKKTHKTRTCSAPS